jgi:transposase-like protein
MQARTPDSTVSIDQQKGVIALLREPTVAKAAESIGIDESTMYRWMKEPGFSKEFREARRDSFRHAIGLCNKYAPAAVQALMKILQDPAAAHSAKVSAASALLKFSRESIELDDLAARIEALEHVTGPQALPMRPSTPPSPAMDQAA